MNKDIYEPTNTSCMWSETAAHELMHTIELWKEKMNIF